MDIENELLNEKPELIRLGITHGDLNSISYEVILKTLADPRIYEYFIPVLYGTSKLVSYHRKLLNIPNIPFHAIKNANQALPERVNIYNLLEQEVKVDIGQSTEIAGTLALQALEAATKSLAEGTIDALITGPINKQNIQGNNFSFPGHTEYFADKFKTKEYLMLMVSNSLRVGMATTHVPLKDVPGMITQEIIRQKIGLMNKSLIRDFGIRRPKIAVLGLNPHSGDKGLMGSEEESVIMPAIQRAFSDGIMAFGPYPADGFFGSGNFSRFDGILAMYHDQGMIPFKTMSFQSGINFTAGLPYIRTSPAHGTAYEIAGKNIASPDSFREAIYLAIDLVRNRKQYDLISANPLKTSALEADSDADKNALKSLKEIGDDPLVL